MIQAYGVFAVGYIHASMVKALVGSKLAFIGATSGDSPIAATLSCAGGWARAIHGSKQKSNSNLGFAFTMRWKRPPKSAHRPAAKH